MQFNLPAAIEPFREKLLETKQPFIRIKTQPTRKMNLWESKVGGQPYMPKGAVWPCAPDGRELFFLAQLNFADMPPIQPFPSKGIIQFFIYDDDLYGMDFDDGENPDTFRVIYHSDPVQDASQLRKDFQLLRDFDELPHHPDESYPLSFALEEGVLPMTDYRFYPHFGADFFRQFGEKEWDIQEDFGKKVRADGHKVGGYAYFTQDDPRRTDDPMLLLFQLDSDERADLMWGDMGVGHFFIRAADLEKRDFSKVLYDWDCL